MVGSATVTTGFGLGRAQVTVNADGSVLLDGQPIALEPGQSVSLNATSSLTRNEDGSYTVSSRSGRVTSTMAVQEHEEGSYLDVSTTVDGVQTVGWLQRQV